MAQGGTLFVLVLVLAVGVSAAPDLLKYQCADPMCGMLSFDFLNTRQTSILEGGITARECVREDYGGLLPMKCDDKTKTRTLIPFLRPPAVCNGGYHPPPIVHNIPCSLTCGAGNYLDIPELRSAEEPKPEAPKPEAPKPEAPKEEPKPETPKEDSKPKEEEKPQVGGAATNGTATNSTAPAGEVAKNETMKVETPEVEASKPSAEGPAKTNGVGGEGMRIMSISVEADAGEVAVVPPMTTMAAVAEPAVCRECPAGTFSRGGAVLWDEWDHWPMQFLTTCSQSQGWCSPWVLNGTSVHSGDNHYNHNMQTELILEINLVTPGYVVFTYRVDAEAGYDSLQFYDNNDPLLGYRGESHQKYFKTVKFDLATTGHHTLRWVYKKDADYSGGEDRAEIRDIEVQGVAFAAIRCEPCVPGTFTDKAQMEKCTECPRDTFAEVPSSTECKPCPPGQYAKKGSAHCVDRPPCKDSDFYQENGKCEKGKMTVKKVLDPGHICMAPPDFDPNKSEVVDCDPPVCHPGEYREENEWQCKFCPDLMFSHGGTNEAKPCEACGPGTMAIREWHWDDFTLPTLDTDSGCVGECNHETWIMADKYMTSGMGHGEDAQIWYEFGIFMDMPGEVTVDFELFCDKPGSEMVFYLDVIKQSRVACYADSKLDAGSRTIKIPTKGYHRVAWLFKKTAGTTPSDYAVVRRVVAKGLSKTYGGASTCTPCPAGTFSAENGAKCVKCPPGTFSEGEASQCTPCADGLISPDWGSRACFPCGEGTTAVGGTECLTDCRPEVGLINGATVEGAEEPVLKFDLTPLKDQRVGPVMMNITDADIESIAGGRNSYYLSVCGIPSNDTVCTNSEGYPMTAFGCQRRSGRTGSADLGGVISYVSYDADGTTGLRVRYDHGVGSCGTSKAPRRTTIDFVCDQDGGMGMPEVVAEPNEEEDVVCNYHFRWVSHVGCSICHPSSMDALVTECRGGYRTRKLQVESSKCVPPPSMKLESIEECQVEVSHTTFYVGILLGIVGAFIVVPAMVYFFIQYRKYHALYSQYAPVGTQEGSGARLPFSDSEDEFNGNNEDGNI